MSNEPENTGTIRDEKGRFVPGVSGNPEGKPPGSISIVARLKKIFEEEPEMFEKYCRDILKDPNIKKSVIEQVDSKPRQPVDMEINIPNSLIELIRGVTNTARDKDIQPKGSD